MKQSFIAALMLCAWLCAALPASVSAAPAAGTTGSIVFCAKTDSAGNPVDPGTTFAVNQQVALVISLPKSDRRLVMELESRPDGATSTFDWEAGLAGRQAEWSWSKPGRYTVNLYSKYTRQLLASGEVNIVAQASSQPQEQETRLPPDPERAEIKPQDGMAGKWILAEATVNGTTMTIAELSTRSGRTIEVVFEFKDDGDVIGTAIGMGLGDGEGTYEVDGDQVSVTIDGDTRVMTREGGRLILEEQGARLVFVREGAGGGSGDDSAAAKPEADDKPSGSSSGEADGMRREDVSDTDDSGNSGGESAPGNSIVGAWIEDGGREYYQFNDDGLYIIGISPEKAAEDGWKKGQVTFTGKYVFNGQELMLNYNYLSDELFGPIPVEFDGGRMALTNKYERGKIWYVRYEGKPWQ